MSDLSGHLLRLWVVCTTALARDDRDQRGDVPGWVLVTVMTAALVVALGAFAKGELRSILGEALRSVR